jgi:hypothetical protein
MTGERPHVTTAHESGGRGGALNTQPFMQGCLCGDQVVGAGKQFVEYIGFAPVGAEVAVEALSVTDDGGLLASWGVKDFAGGIAGTQYCRDGPPWHPYSRWARGVCPSDGGLG